MYRSLIVAITAVCIPLPSVAASPEDEQREAMVTLEAMAKRNRIFQDLLKTMDRRMSEVLRSMDRLSGTSARCSSGLDSLPTPGPAVDELNRLAGDVIAALRVSPGGLRDFPRFAPRPRTTRTERLLEYYVRDIEAEGLPLNDLRIVDGKAALDDRFSIVVHDRGFSILRDHEVMSEETFAVPFAPNDHVATSTPGISPNTLMRSGPSSWLLAIYGAEHHDVQIFGIRLAGESVETSYIYRVKLFGDGLASPPYLTFGPGLVYQGTDRKTHAYWFFEESDDVARVYQSSGPLKNDMSQPVIDKSGALQFNDGEISVRWDLFVPEYWADFLKRVAK